MPEPDASAAVSGVPSWNLTPSRSTAEEIRAPRRAAQQIHQSVSVEGHEDGDQHAKERNYGGFPLLIPRMVPGARLEQDQREYQRRRRIGDASPGCGAGTGCVQEG